MSRGFDFADRMEGGGRGLRVFHLNGSCLSVNVSSRVSVERIFAVEGKKDFPPCTVDSCVTRLIR